MCTPTRDEACPGRVAGEFHAPLVEVLHQPLPRSLVVDGTGSDLGRAAPLASVGLGQPVSRGGERSPEVGDDRLVPLLALRKERRGEVLRRTGVRGGG
jgi:hypothetical protein